MIPSAVSPGDAQFVVSALAVLGLQKAKSEQGIGKLLPWITHQTDTLNRLFAVAISLAGSIGVSVSFHAGVLTIGGLTFSTVVSAAVFFGRSLAGQELIYRVVKISSHVSELSTALAVLTTPPSGELPPSDPRKSWDEVATEIAEAKNSLPTK